jgi:hypothetical protein
VSVSQTLGPLPFGVLISEAEGSRSREESTIAASQTILPGTVLGKVVRGAITNRADVVRTGNGTIGTLSRTGAALVGAYTIRCIAAASNAGTFAVIDPNGRLLPDATVGVAYVGEVGFTIADGSSDFVVGDTFFLDVAAGSGQYEALDLAATDGTGRAYAVALQPVTTGVGQTKQIVTVVRDAEVKADLLQWPAGITTNQKNAALAQLAEVGLIAR